MYCTTEARSGLNVTVTDASTGLPITTATVTAAEGDYVEILENGLDGDYTGAWERAGVYEIEVIADGYQPGERNGVRVEQDDCHVDGVALEIALQPAP